jgi:formiminoglutamate deiminase
VSVTYVCERALLPDGRVARDVAVTIEDGRFTRVEPRAVDVEAGGDLDPDAQRLAGLVLPGLADAHSHAFHRALRGRTHTGRGSFWSWRELMYDVASRLDPDRYLDLARATFAESALAGTTTIGEFHYLHHQPDGSPYADPNEVGHALIEAARDAGVRLTLLDTCYLAGGFGRPLEGVQRRFGDGDAAGWAERVTALADDYVDRDGLVVGATIHSVRAVPVEQLPTVVDWARPADAPLHVHVSEQPAENEACRDAHGVSPTALLEQAGALGPRMTAVHATHVDDHDLGLLGRAGASVCLCPTTERDLADGVGPARAMLDAGVALAFGSDSRAVVEPFEEARAAELDLRLTTGERGHLASSELVAALTADGHRCLGQPDAGRIEVGARADLVAVRLDSVRTAGTADDALDTVLYAATAADVTDVIVDGRPIVRDGQHRLGDVGRLLADAIDAVTATMSGPMPVHRGGRR